jgi:hypothetical protein
MDLAKTPMIMSVRSQSTEAGAREFSPGCLEALSLLDRLEEEEEWIMICDTGHDLPRGLPDRHLCFHCLARLQSNQLLNPLLTPSTSLSRPVSVTHLYFVIICISTSRTLQLANFLCGWLMILHWSQNSTIYHAISLLRFNCIWDSTSICP